MRPGLHKLNPIDPNPAIAAHAVFSQSGHSRMEKQPFFHIFPKENPPKEITAHRVPIYQIKAHKMVIPMQKKSFRFDKKVFGGNLREFGEILGKYCMFDIKSVGSKGLIIRKYLAAKWRGDSRLLFFAFMTAPRSIKDNTVFS